MLTEKGLNPELSGFQIINLSFDVRESEDMAWKQEPFWAAALFHETKQTVQHFFACCEQSLNWLLDHPPQFCGAGPELVTL